MTVKLHYFAGRGRAETTRWLLAANEISFENVAITTPEELAALRASGLLPFDQMPLLQIDGLNLSQSSAMVRYLARRGDLYGDSDLDAVECDMVAGAAADFAETGLQAAFQPTRDVAIANLERALAKFGPKFEARLAAQNSGFIACQRMTFADIVLTEVLTGYLEWDASLLKPWPLLATLQKTVCAHPGIAAYLVSRQRWPMSGEKYVVDVARVLQRALPPHMPDADRFLVQA